MLMLAFASAETMMAATPLQDSTIPRTVNAAVCAPRPISFLLERKVHHLMLMLALASAENMVAATPLRLAICRPTAASTQQSSIFSTLLMRPARMASANLRRARVRCLGLGQRSYTCSVRMA